MEGHRYPRPSMYHWMTMKCLPEVDNIINWHLAFLYRKSKIISPFFLRGSKRVFPHVENLRDLNRVTVITSMNLYTFLSWRKIYNTWLFVEQKKLSFPQRFAQFVLWISPDFFRRTVILTLVIVPRCKIR